MTYLNFLKRTKLHHSSRWIIKFNKEKIREVKLIFNPDEYRKGERARPLHTQDGLIRILDKEKNKY